MVILILSIGGVLFAAIALGIILVQRYRIQKGIITIDEEYNGPEQISVAVHALIRFILKRSVYARKFVMQYVFHVLVRLMHYFHIFTTKLYAMSRNWFVRNAVRNKGTVPHFWQHLKVYKQEMDKEREQDDAIK